MSDSFDFIDIDTTTPGLDHIDMTPQNPIPTFQEGRVFYDSTKKALCYYCDISSSVLEIGFEEWVRARNSTGSTIVNGSPVVVSGATGQTPTLALADASVHHHHQVVGLVTNDIDNNTVNLVTESGEVNGLDTTGSGAFAVGAETWADGDTLYVSDTAGKLTNVQPAAPLAAISVGIVSYAHASNGKILVRVADSQTYLTNPTATLEIISGITMGGSGGEYGWRDLIGDVIPKTSGAGSPTLDIITGNIRGFRYSVGDDGDIIYHIPHDYAPGTDLFFHPHWTHNGTNISGSLVITVYATYAKGHQQASFSAQITATVTDGSLTIANTPALFHRIPEIQFSTPGGSASQLDTDLLEVDGLIIVHYDVATIPTITGGSGEPFLLTFDIHYKSTGINTLNKAPNFYA